MKMKTTFIVLCTVFLGVVVAGSSNNSSVATSGVVPVSTMVLNISSTIHPSPSATKNASIHHNSTHMSSHVHTASRNMSIHNRTSSIPSTVFHNSTIMPNSTISPSPTMNFSSSINITSVSHNASHMTYTVSPTHSIYPSNASSTVVPSSSVAPTTPPPKLPKGKFSVKKENDSCLLFWLSFEFDVKYKNKSGNEVSRTIIMPDSSHANASGYCEKSNSCINITWANFYSLEACFETSNIAKRDNADIHWTTANMTISVIVANNPTFVDFGSNSTEIRETQKVPGKLAWISGSDGHSLNCSQEQKLEFGSKITAVFENVRIQPFAVKDNHFSKHVDTCGATPKPTAVPTSKKDNKNTIAIAVGCSLGGLVLIVLIGYFIGRRRKNAIRYRKL